MQKKKISDIIYTESERAKGSKKFRKSSEHLQKKKISDIINTENEGTESPPEKNDSGVAEEMRRLLTLPLNDSVQIVKSKNKNLSVA